MAIEKFTKNEKLTSDKMNEMVDAVNDNTSSISDIAVTGGASTANAVIFSDGQNAETKVSQIELKVGGLSSQSCDDGDEELIINTNDGQQILYINEDGVKVKKITYLDGSAIGVDDMPISSESEEAESANDEIVFANDDDSPSLIVDENGIKVKSITDLDGNDIVNSGVKFSVKSNVSGVVTFEPFTTKTNIVIKVNMPPKYNGSSDSSYYYKLEDNVYVNGTLYSYGATYDNYPIVLPKGQHKITLTLNGLTYAEGMISAKSYDSNLKQYSSASKVFQTSRLISRYDVTNPSYLNKADEVSILHITDTHSDVVRWDNAVKLADELSVDVLIHSGDICDTGFSSPHAYFTDNYPQCPVLACIGNHDKSSVSNMLTLLNPHANRYGETLTTTWYYKDVNNVRFVMLNVYDRLNDPGTWRVYYSQEQIDWLLSTLDSAITAGKSVVLVAHECDAKITFSGGIGCFSTNKGGYETYKTWEGNPICDIIEAFKTGGTINQSYVEMENDGTTLYQTITVQHTFASGGEFVMWLTGHHHCDFLRTIDGYTRQIEFTGTTGAMKVHKYQCPWGDDYLARLEDSYTENACTGITINTNKKTISLVRFGADYTINNTDRLFSVINYINN